MAGGDGGYAMGERNKDEAAPNYSSMGDVLGKEKEGNRGLTSSCNGAPGSYPGDLRRGMIGEAWFWKKSAVES